ncbi:MAG: sigma-54-dependent Fis family transcriptional regulator [Candidatus Cloacimonetes bacterium]|nr:sigma-54-dependent Fis family transcriptional regulator [Candidatus Cloacimonadota bacterium]
MRPRIMVVDDERGILDTVEILLRGEDFEPVALQSGKEAIARLEEIDPDIVLTDIRMPGVTGLDVLQAVRAHDPEVPVILMTAQASLQSAMQAVNEGAFYYLQKPFSNAELVALCRRAAQTRRLTTENKTLKREIRRRDTSNAKRPVGRNRAFLEVVRLAETVAPTDSTVLITGESGTGKEVIARFIHELSERESGPFISINCGALPENLLESELFGHVKGSFTGAVRDKEGLLVAAEGGTFFLDEVGEMSPALQVKLLRAIQEREVVPVGATDPVDIDVRIIAATNRDLEQEIRRGTFRSELYYRLNVISLHLPPLRERPEDVALLAEHFLQALAEDKGGTPRTLTPDALSALQAYEWPGNVRELENALERAAILSKGDAVDVDALPSRITNPESAPLVSERPHTNPTLELIERAYILWVLQAEGGNKARAAEVLGIDPSTLYRKLNRYGMTDG